MGLLLQGVGLTEIWQMQVTENMIKGTQLTPTMKGNTNYAQTVFHKYAFSSLVFFSSPSPLQHMHPPLPLLGCAPCALDEHAQWRLGVGGLLSLIFHMQGLPSKQTGWDSACGNSSSSNPNLPVVLQEYFTLQRHCRSGVFWIDCILSLKRWLGGPTNGGGCGPISASPGCWGNMARPTEKTHMSPLKAQNNFTGTWSSKHSQTPNNLLPRPVLYTLQGSSPALVSLCQVTNIPLAPPVIIMGQKFDAPRWSFFLWRGIRIPPREIGMPPNWMANWARSSPSDKR